MNRLRLLPAILITSMLLSSCGVGAANNNEYKALPPDVYNQLGLYYFALVPPLCKPEDVSKISFVQKYISKKTDSLVGPADTRFTENGVTIGIGFDPNYSPSVYQALVAHELVHGCGVAAIEGEIETVQEILNFQGVTMRRDISDQPRNGPFIDLTVKTKNIANFESTERIPFEEIFAYYYGTAIIENKYGHGSEDELVARMINIHPSSSTALKNLFEKSNTTFDDLSGYKRRADALSIITAMQDGLLIVGTENGIDTTNSKSDPRSKFWAVNFTHSAFQYDLLIGENKTKAYSNMTDALSWFYFQKEFGKLSSQELVTITNIINQLISPREGVIVN